MNLSFQKKLEKILRNGNTVLNEEHEEGYGTKSPTHVCPEPGEEVTTSLDGTGKIDATRPIKAGADKTLKTTPAVSATEGPTGHIPTNSDLPRAQKDGLGTSNSPGKNSLPPTPKVYGLHEEEEEAKKLKEEEEEKKLPPFMKKKKLHEEEEEAKKLKEEEEEKKLHEEEEEAKKLKEEEEESKRLKEESGTEAAKTLKRSGSGEKADKIKEEFDHEEGSKTKEKLGVKEEIEPDDDKDDKKIVKEATAALFAGETISEVLKEKTATIFEATLSQRIKDYRKTLNGRYTKKLNERVEEIREELSNSISGHLDLVVEHWVKENEVPLERAIKSELVEEFIGGLKNLFEEHYIELPQEKVDVVAEMANRINTLEKKLNEQIDTNVQLQQSVKLHERTEVFEKMTRGMVATKIEKLRNLSENVDYKNAKQFETALVTLKESVEGTQKQSTSKQTLSEQTLEQSPEPGSGERVDKVKEFLARMNKNG